ncbi:MAG TPA: amidohydrolase family protein [Pyrinomonadaceae bacterium]|nr:amidohydrolase family protein [Pyrinomonadaceae bacterium]
MTADEKDKNADLTRRAFLTNAAVALAGLSFAAKAARPQRQSKTYEFINGRWFDGRSFRNRRFYSVNGLLTSKKPGRVDSVIDLTGKYVIPPFGEAHNHNVEDAGRIGDLARRYLQDGIFYVKNPNNLPQAKIALLGKVNIPTSIDAVFANGGLTASGGHPLGVVRRNLERGARPEVWAEGGFYHTIDNLADLERKWERIVAGKPEFIKTYLQYSEEYEKRRNDDAYFDWRGLDPRLLPEIVRRAHRANLRVSTHVETATDFHNALIAGVDEINHTPGFRPENNDWKKYDSARFKISGRDAQLAARNRVVVVSTLVSAIEQALQKKEGEPFAEMRELLLHNLRLLNRQGVLLAIGSDSYRQTALVEAVNLHRLGVFDNRTLLKMWCETTARAIFPKRKIGYLKDGYEASFLVLDDNPLQDFASVQKINRRFKQGEFLSL